MTDIHLNTAAGGLRRKLSIVVAAMIAAILPSSFLPTISLDTAFADGLVRLTDTATWPQMAMLSMAAVVLLISRGGVSPKRRSIDAGVLAAVMLIALVGNALLNEHIVKPAFAIPRPNIVELTEAGSLGPDYPDAESFYATGDKEARRSVLGDLLPTVDTPALSSLVRAHWIHETGYSFPSGHATAAVTLATLLAALGFLWLDGWRLRLTTWVVPMWAVTIAYTRPWLGVHTGPDVIAGGLAGILWGILAAAVVVNTTGYLAAERKPAV